MRLWLSSSVLLRIHRSLLAVALVILAFHLVVYAVYAINLILFPFDYDQGEGFELVDTIMFSQGRWPYQDTEVYPFYSSNYPPLFHLIAVPFVWLFGPAYWYGRLLGFIATLVTACAIGFSVYRESQNRWIAALSGLAFLASNTVYHIGPLFRQHAPMVMFETLAVITLAHANEIHDRGKRRRRIAAGLALILAAGFTKQLAIVTALAAGAFLFIRQPRRAVVESWPGLSASPSSSG
jgi:4-amino-4-deoxy-L-arabinose transferase-like glycosyltransferase